MVREEDLGDVVSITVLDEVEDEALDERSTADEVAPPPVEDIEETQTPTQPVDDLRLPEGLSGHDVGPDEPDAWGTTMFDPDGAEEHAGPEGDDDAFSGSLATRVLSFLRADADSDGSDGRDAHSAAPPSDLVARLTDARRRLESFRGMAARIHGARNGSHNGASESEVPPRHGEQVSPRQGEYDGVVEIPKA